MKKLIILLSIAFMLLTLAGMARAYDFTVNIPDVHVTRTRDALCGVYDYDTNKKSGESKKAFCERMSREHFFLDKLRLWETQIGVRTFKDNLETEYKAAWDPNS